jgi:hypothetical protein
MPSRGKRKGSVSRVSEKPFWEWSARKRANYFAKNNALANTLLKLFRDAQIEQKRLGHVSESTHRAFIGIGRLLKQSDPIVSASVKNQLAMAIKKFEEK